MQCISIVTKRFPADTSSAERPYPQTNDRILSEKGLPMPPIIE